MLETMEKSLEIKPSIERVSLCSLCEIITFETNTSRFALERL